MPYGKHGNSGDQRAFLRKDAAESWNRAIADVERRTGIKLRVRGWNRTYDEQVEFFLARHRVAKASETACCVWQGRRYHFTGTAHAAPPGISNHGWALAVDVIDFGGVGDFDNPRRKKAFPILAEHGWTETEGRGRIQEPWHLVYDPTKDKHKGEKPEEDDMTPAQDAALKEILDFKRAAEKVLLNGNKVPRTGKDGVPWTANLMAAIARLDSTLVKGVTPDWPAKLMAAIARLDSTLVKGVTPDWPAKLMASQAKTERDAAKINGLEAAVAALAQSKGLDGEAIKKAVLDKIDEALDGLTVTLTNAG
ncbi:M15 family metallopeptidase [Puerhibacterium puerhi]|uniref:M15 family metallopeptidase n=1 Tax=Puerhibacterium puerhi TaxID=2692623 RepID=UPI001359F9E8|nr:M15 family metallopeptidase [Puerhibacterium puerhi]